MSIEAREQTVEQLFNISNYQFRIPDYQRPYLWTTDEVSNLLDDIISASPYGDTNHHDIYFLGSIVLIKRSGRPEADVVDGQQRLTTLCLILSVICHLMSKEPEQERRSDLIRQEHIERERALDGSLTSELRLRKLDDDFFGKFVRSRGGMNDLNEISLHDKVDSQLQLIENARHLLDTELHKPEQVEDLISWLEHLAKTLLESCYLVAISTEKLNSAYRIFSTINSRGIDLAANDILKAEILGKIGDENRRTNYAEIWAKEEADLGREGFERLFYIIRRFLSNQKRTGDLLETYREQILPRYKPSGFIDIVLRPSSDMFEQVENSNYCCDNLEHQNSIRLLCKFLSRIDNSDWIAPAVYFMVTYPEDSQSILDFLTQLERLAAGLMISRHTSSNRAGVYHQLVEAIKEDKDTAIQKCHQLLGGDLPERIMTALGGDIYQAKQFKSYVLLRLDSALADGGKSPSLDGKMPTIEHVLPQKPESNSQWMQDWGDIGFIEQWVHRLGNLAFLYGRKNSAAGNKDFPLKKETYFLKRGSAVFPITARVISRDEWTPKVVEEYQEEYLKKLKDIWSL